MLGPSEVGVPQSSRGHPALPPVRLPFGLLPHRTMSFLRTCYFSFFSAKIHGFCQIVQGLGEGYCPSVCLLLCKAVVHLHHTPFGLWTLPPTPYPLNGSLRVHSSQSEIFIDFFLFFWGVPCGRIDSWSRLPSFFLECFPQSRLFPYVSFKNSLDSWTDSLCKVLMVKVDLCLADLPPPSNNFLANLLLPPKGPLSFAPRPPFQSLPYMKSVPCSLPHLTVLLG